MVQRTQTSLHPRRLLLVGATGLVLALGLALSWRQPAPPAPEPVVAMVPVIDPVVTATAPNSAPLQQVAPPRDLPTLEELSPSDRSRAEWAQDRADWIGGGWILCDVSAFDGNMAELAFDERGYHGVVDPATTIMAVDDGWLSLVVRDAQGEVDVEYGGLFDERNRLRLRWEGADGDAPGHCIGEPTPVTLDAQLEITVLEADGSPLLDEDDVQTEVMGCGTVLTDSGSVITEAQPCTLSIVRRRKSLPSQVTHGDYIAVDPIAGGTTQVTLIAPPAPNRWRLPDLDDTLLLLDVAAFSGTDVVADSLDVIVHDLRQGQFDPTVVDLWRDAADTTWHAENAGPMDAIIASWDMWAKVQEIRWDEDPSTSESEPP